MKGLKRTGLLFLALLLATCTAAGAETFTVRRADGVGAEVSSIKTASFGWYLFLPAYMKGTPLTLEMKDSVTLKTEKDSLKTGATFTLSGGETLHTVQGKYTDTIHVMAGCLPALHLTTEKGGLARVQADKDHKEKADLLALSAGGDVLWSGALKNMKGHGNATYQFKKKSYQIQFKNKTDILGLSAQKKFILLANQHENSLLRNRITFDLARGAGLRYTPGSRAVDLFVNGEYLGCYLLCNKVTVSSGSVDVLDAEEMIEAANPELAEREVVPSAYGSRKAEKGTYKGVVWPQEPEDVTGGYLLELEYDKRYPDEASGVVTGRGQSIVVKSPEYMTMAQGEDVSSLLNSFERAIFSKDGTDAQTGRHYTELADRESLVRKYMVEEISKNYDGNKSSQFFYKDSDDVDPLLYAGPVWDYDSAWGNYAGEGRLDIAAPEGLTVGGIVSEHGWWAAMAHRDDFAAEVSATWTAVYRPMLQVLTGDLAPWDGCPVAPLSELAAEMDASAQMNFKRWNIFNASNRAVKTGATYAENIETLTQWIRDRVAFLDSKW